MAQYEFNIDYNDEPYETNQTLEQLIARDLPLGVTLIELDANEHGNDATLVVAADENDAKTISELAYYAGHTSSDDLNEYARIS